MKNTTKTILFAVAISCTALETSAFEPASATTSAAKFETATNSLFGRRKGYRKKRGFMWGLFKKKNSCNCPKH